MATFEEIINQIREIAGTTVEESTFAELNAAYTEDLSIRDAAVKDRDAKIEAAKADIVARDNEVLRLKAVNYDLISSVPKTGEPDDIDETEPKTGSGIDSLFE